MAFQQTGCRQILLEKEMKRCEFKLGDYRFGKREDF
jgi:hypothetical protein